MTLSWTSYANDVILYVIERQLSTLIIVIYFFIPLGTLCLFRLEPINETVFPLHYTS